MPETWWVYIKTPSCSIATEFIDIASLCSGPSIQILWQQCQSRGRGERLGVLGLGSHMFGRRRVVAKTPHSMTSVLSLAVRKSLFSLCLADSSEPGNILFSGVDVVIGVDAQVFGLGPSWCLQCCCPHKCGVAVVFVTDSSDVPFYCGSNVASADLVSQHLPPQGVKP